MKHLMTVLACLLVLCMLPVGNVVSLDTPFPPSDNGGSGDDGPNGDDHPWGGENQNDDPIIDRDYTGFKVVTGNTLLDIVYRFEFVRTFVLREQTTTTSAELKARARMEANSRKYSPATTKR